MILDWLLHPFITHAIVFLLGIPVGVLLDKFFMHSRKSNYNMKVIFVNILHFAILSMYVGLLAHAQWFGGMPPNLIFSGLAAVSFGALVGEKDFLSKILAAVLKK